METESKIRILIADDHPIFRQGLRRLLETERDFEVVGEATDGEEAVRMGFLLLPDVILLDVAMPRLNGLDVASRIGACISTRIILLTAAIRKAEVVKALQLGARGVVMKQVATDLLIKSIRSVVAGEYWIGGDIVEDLVGNLRRMVAAGQDDGRLTSREREIVSAVASGQTNKGIATRLQISEATVKHHLTSIFTKTGVSNRLELAVFARDRLSN